ncbi:MAG TPA: DUF2842 domain-containing protein [Beijerinckiaceae bacterium]|nr:DUF2842 domain-containing protein [Rhodoblastus sp.]MCB9999432.1 DUF2842 domain-containing protein [Methylobacteriaceae bacterium]MCC2109446.1 DUF2842 domain-containing protein [Hyphomicrobiales bacterium]HRY04906.1 DUF2842 domain-containing protein [Beijerinckiaceae bacterium]MCB1525309.1 DUF2842 domain-containing protein [Rhodoblastus sp.]
MPIRIRKLIGALFMVVYVIFYALIAMALAQSRPLQEASPWLQPLLYAVLGTIWIVPLLPVVAWMAREDR